jgi:SAM-dependent methyltransferase
LNAPIIQYGVATASTRPGIAVRLRGGILQHLPVPDDLSLDESYDDFPRVEEAFGERLDESLDPRGPSSLWTEFERLSPDRADLVVDVGCGEGEDSIELARRYGVPVVGVDPVDRHIELAEAAAAAAGVQDQVSFQAGVAEATGLGDGTADLVWAKESLMFADLDRAFTECRRVLRPGGSVFVYQVCTGPLMGDEEAERFWCDAAGARHVRPGDLLRAADESGFVTTFRTDFAGEWGEFGQERSGAGGRRLLHAARLLREPSRYVSEFGETNYRIMLGDCLWHVYRMIGKLHGVAFGFQRG